MPKFQKRHYLSVTAVFQALNADQQRKLLTLAELEEHARVLGHFCRVFAADNPRFDVVRFLAACR